MTNKCYLIQSLEHCVLQFRNTISHVLLVTLQTQAKISKSLSALVGFYLYLSVCRPFFVACIIWSGFDIFKGLFANVEDSVSLPPLLSRYSQSYTSQVLL